MTTKHPACLAPNERNHSEAVQNDDHAVTMTGNSIRLTDSPPQG